MIKPMLSLVYAMLAFSYLSAQAGSAKPRLEPVYSESPGGLVWLEAEDAVSTNFASSSTLDYGSSAYRIMQLNREGQTTSAPFYAEYTFVLEEAGQWSLWMGGTPPGPKAEDTASFVSPVTYQIDGGTALPLYREDVAVNEKYSTVNYWFVAKAPVTLSAGVHTIRFEVGEKRRYDARYYFSLDAFFLVKSDSPVQQGMIDRAALPPLFPRDLADRRIDQPYLSIPQYEYSIQSAPKDPSRYLLLAQVYNLIGDNSAAVKTLSRGRVIAGDDLRFTLQTAKSLIWSGEIDEGLRLYREYLNSPEADRVVWAEAAKIAAWLMKYRESEQLYRDALGLYPDDVNLKVNLALTLLWSGRVRDGERLLSSVWDSARVDPRTVASLGTIYTVSGYPDKAIITYRNGIELFPDQLELYFSLVQAYEKTNMQAEAREVLARIATTFVESERLAGKLAVLELESSLKDTALEAYRQRLASTPDDLGLRQELVRAYYWNGMLAEALGESSNIIVNRLYSILVELDGDLAGTWRLMDFLQVYRPAVSRVIPEADALSLGLKKALDAHTKAQGRNDQALKGKDARRKETAAAELATAQHMLAEELAKTYQFMDSSAEMLSKALDLTELAIAESLSADEDLALAQKLKPWTWNSAEELAGLRLKVQSSTLAWHALARISSMEGRRALPPGSYELTAASQALRSQLALWESGSVEAIVSSPEAYFAHGADLKAQASLVSDFISRFTSSIPPSVASSEPSALEMETMALFDEGTAGQAQDALQELSATRALGQERAAGIQSALAALYNRARTRLRIRMYQFDTEAMQDRREQADIYLSLERPNEAVNALARVLLVNPSDIASMFTLARALETGGDWRGAMTKYREVYGLNPRYENAASSYNRQAETHSASLDTIVATTVDTLETTGSTRIEFKAPLTSVVEVQAAYEATQRKLHAPTGGSFPESINLHTFELTLPLVARNLGVTVYGTAGGTLQNRLQNLLPPSVADFSLATISDYAAAAPRLAAGLAWNQGGLSASAGYRFNQIEDTFYAGRTVYYEHAGQAGASVYFSSPARMLARTLSGSALVDVAGIFSPYLSTATNFVTSASAEFHVGSMLAAAPLSLLDLGGTVAWQDSTITGVSDYYAPSRVLSIKGGPALSLRLGDEAGWNSTLSARVWPGYYAAAGEGRLSVDGQLMLGVAKRGVNMFMSVDGGWVNATGTSPSYWSFRASLGAKLAMVDYLIP